jgi:hypothetical protein
MGPFGRNNDPYEGQDPTERTKLLPDRESSDSSRQSLDSLNDGNHLLEVNGQTVGQETLPDIEDTDNDTDAESHDMDVRAAMSMEDDPEMACVCLRLNVKLM